jgi:hypothetical protein
LPSFAFHLLKTKNLLGRIVGMKTARPCLLPLCAAATLLVAGPARADDDKPSCSYVEVARVPVHYTGTGLEVTIEGAINGTPALMLADTGAYNSALTRTGTEKRGLRLRMTGRSAAGVGGESRLYKTRVDQFVAGPANSS